MTPAGSGVSRPPTRPLVVSWESRVRSQLSSASWIVWRSAASVLPGEAGHARRRAVSPRPTSARRRAAGRRARSSCRRPAGSLRSASRALRSRRRPSGSAPSGRRRGRRGRGPAGSAPRSRSRCRGRRPDVAVAGEDEHRARPGAGPRRRRRRRQGTASRRRAHGSRLWSAQLPNGPDGAGGSAAIAASSAAWRDVAASHRRHGNGPSPQFVVRSRTMLMSLRRWPCC